jgi:hypothetical protein
LTNFWPNDARPTNFWPNDEASFYLDGDLLDVQPPVLLVEAKEVGLPALHVGLGAEDGQLGEAVRAGLHPRHTEGQGLPPVLHQLFEDQPQLVVILVIETVFDVHPDANVINLFGCTSYFGE